MPLAELKEKYKKLSALEKAHTGWEGEYEASSKQVTIIRYTLSVVFMVYYYYCAQCSWNELKCYMKSFKISSFPLMVVSGSCLWKYGYTNKKEYI